MGFSHFLGTASLSNNVILGIKHVNWHMLYVLLLQAEIERLRLRLHTFKRESNLCIFNLACCGIYLTDFGVNCPVWEISADVNSHNSKEASSSRAFKVKTKLFKSLNLGQSQEKRF